MADLIQSHGPCGLAQRTFEPFHTIVGSIISQQLSVNASDTIKRRIAQLVPLPFQPKDLLRLHPKQLRDAGLSSRKVTYIRELAERVIDGQLSFEELAGADNAAVIGALTELRGVGQWTAEMFLIFGLQRADVLALADAGLQRAVRLLYGDTKQLHLVGQCWQPYSSIASWYLWRHLDN
ncbi:MAG: DNA-3-methyladenine glycosylase family protein [Casimicrobiaceae bacterium]